MPTLIQNVTERANSSREANIAYKITQATDKMKALGLLDGSYKTTDEFVDELQKHLKIAKRCSAENIADCWPTEKVMTAEGEEFEVSKAKTGKNLNLKSNTSNNVGLVLVDGASIILTYNQDSTGIDESDPITASKKSLPVGGGKSEDFAYTSSTTGAIDFVMDVNGGKGPNSETINNKYHDIRSFKAARFSKGCAGTEIPGTGCVVNFGTSYEAIDCTDSSNSNYCGSTPSGYNNDYWAGAKKACDDIGMTLPDLGTLQNSFVKKSEYPDVFLQSDWFWSSSEYSTSDAYLFNYGYGLSAFDGKGYQYSVLCLGN